MRIVQYNHELSLISSVLQAWGVPPERAQTQARSLTEADLRGHSSHGIQRLPVLVGRIRAGLIVPDAEPEFEWRTESVLLVDGARGLGPCVAFAALERLIERAPRSGLVIGAIAGANHLGLLAPYVEEITRHGLIGIAMTTSEALVHPWGGSRAMVGTNPIATGIPAEPSPLIVDMSTAAVSMGKVQHYASLGAELPPGWAVDESGQPTTDPAAAVRGAISPFGGAKGYALGLAIEALVGVLTGSAFGTDVHGTLDTEHVANKGDLFFVIDSAIFGSPDSGRVGNYLQTVRKESGDERVLIPGDRTREARERGLRDGFAVSDHAWSEAEALLEQARHQREPQTA